MSQPDRFEKERLKKLDRIACLGHDPFGRRFDGHEHIAAVRPRAPQESGVDGESVRVAGRIMLRRKAGKLRFYDLQDYTGRIQLLFSRGDLSDEQWELMGQLDLGDIIGVDGDLRRTDTGEISVFVRHLAVLCKSLAQPPEKFHGVHDVELLLRHRELDLIYTEGVLERMLKRSRIIDSVRRTLGRREFYEVETPVLHAVAGGAAARPFTTHHNTLDMDLFLRIALEIHLKRLMVGGIERVYEIGRVFRNEGIDKTHNPEFTMIEIYQAYGDYKSMMDLTEAIITDAARAATDPENPFVKISLVPNQSSAEETEGGIEVLDGEIMPRNRARFLEHVDKQFRETADPEVEPAAPPYTYELIPPLAVPWGRTEFIDLTPPWPRQKYADLFREHAGCEMNDAAAVRAKAEELAAAGRITKEFIERVRTTEVHPDVIVQEVFEATVEDFLTGPVFVIDYPASLCPLTKRKADDPTVAERFELYIQGMEVANAYTELNDPRLQEELFRSQLAGLSEEDSMAKMDTDFLSALKVGMPPAGGLGIGIDRLVMLLTNSQTIRDVIYFPLLRPES